MCVLSFRCNAVTRTDYELSKVKIRKKIDIVKETLSPVIRFMHTKCDDVDMIFGNGSAILAGTSSGTEEYPFAYVFLTASHVMLDYVSNNDTDIFVDWKLEYWQYSKNGKEIFKNEFYLCNDNEKELKALNYYDSDLDLGIVIVLSVNEIKNITCAKIAKPNILRKIKTGDFVYINGCQRGNQPILRTGVISSISNSYILCSGDAHPGDSGGGVFNEQGELIGIISFKPRGSSTGCGFIPIDIIYQTLVNYGLSGPLSAIWR